MNPEKIDVIQQMKPSIEATLAQKLLSIALRDSLEKRPKRLVFFKISGTESSPDTNAKQRSTSEAYLRAHCWSPKIEESHLPSNSPWQPSSLAQETESLETKGILFPFARAKIIHRNGEACYAPSMASQA